MGVIHYNNDADRNLSSRDTLKVYCFETSLFFCFHPDIQCLERSQLDMFIDQHILWSYILIAYMKKEEEILDSQLLIILVICVLYK